MWCARIRCIYFIAHGLLIWMCALAMKVLKSDYLKKRRFPGSKSLSEPSTKRCASFLEAARMAGLGLKRRIINSEKQNGKSALRRNLYTYNIKIFFYAQS